MSLLPPPIALYPDLDTAFKTIQAHAKGAGYAFRKLDKKPSRAIFACDRGGNYDPRIKASWATHPSKQRNNTGSKKCGCLMKVELRLDKVTTQWMLQVLESAHNHSPSVLPIAHPAHRTSAMSPEVRAEIGTLASAGFAPNQILTALRTSTYPEPVDLVAKDISNLIQEARLQELNGRTPIQWLLEVRTALFN
jgi:hypothetical protein